MKSAFETSTLTSYYALNFSHLPFFDLFMPQMHENAIVTDAPFPASFSFILGLFKRTIQFIQQNNVKIVLLVSCAGIRIAQPLPIATRPELLLLKAKPQICLYSSNVTSNDCKSFNLKGFLW